MPRHRRNPLPKAPPKRRFAGQPSPQQLSSSLTRVRKLARDLPENERNFDPSRGRGSWQGSSRDLVVNGRMDEFTRGFLETALWSSTDNSDDSGGEPLDKNYSIEDFTPHALKELTADCEQFQRENADDLAVAYEQGIRGSEGDDEFSAGHDFWLTRCGHGAGFWDGDYPEPQATRLTKSAEKFGNVDLTLEDGVIHADGHWNTGRLKRNGEQTHFPFGSKRAGALEIPMPEFDWEQIDGDVNLPTYGGIIARSDGQTIDLVEIQPVREYVGDGEAAEVGFPFWTKEASYDIDDLSPTNKEVKAALTSSDVNLDEIEPQWLARAIALACMRYGHGSEEGDGGWAGDKKPGEDGRANLLGSRKVRWGYAGVERKTFAEEASSDDDDFRREVLGEEEELTENRRRGRRMRKNSYELSFSPEFFFAEGEPYDGGPEIPTRRPISVWSAIESMRLGDPGRWAEMAREVFGLDNPQYLTPETVMDKVQETNTCGDLSSPVDVYVDPEGYFTLDVYDEVR